MTTAALDQFEKDTGYGGMTVYLDDERPPPPGWVGVRWPDEAIRMLMTGQVTEISRDQDLGDDVRGTGYTVVLWVERAVAVDGFRPPRISVHTANPSARQKMLFGVRNIERLVGHERASHGWRGRPRSVSRARSPPSIPGRAAQASRPPTGPTAAAGMGR